MKRTAQLEHPAPSLATDERAVTDGPVKQGLALCTAAALALVVALLHLWMMPHHFLQWWGYGAYFLAVALTQGLFGVALLRWPTRLLSLAGISGNLAVILAYVVTRTSGVPVGPHSGKAKDVGALDVATTVAELGVVIALVALLRDAYRRWTINALLLLGAAMWGWRIFGVLS